MKHSPAQTIENAIAAYGSMLYRLSLVMLGNPMDALMALPEKYREVLVLPGLQL